MNYSLEQNRIIWVVGALERLGGLGYLSEIGYKVEEETIDHYLELDEIRDYLFENNKEIFIIMMTLMEESNMSMEELQEIYDLIIDYKENRKKVVVYAMENLVGV
jgi:hypothetical protein